MSFRGLFFGCCLAVSSVVALSACEGTGAAEDAAVENESGEELSTPVSKGAVVKTTANVNFRSGPSTSYKILKVLAKGTQLTVLDGNPTKGFYQLQQGSTSGWVSGKYLEVVSSAPGPGPSPSEPSATCQNVDWTDFQAPTSCDGPSGYTSKQKPSNSVYSTSWFGCYYDGSGNLKTDPSDNCEFACGAQGYCATQGPSCQAKLRWFSADADRFGCGTKIRATNCANGKSVVLVALDRGPNCKSIEQAHDASVLDMSHDAMGYLFDGKFYGGGDHKGVVVEVVDPSTPLGPS